MLDIYSLLLLQTAMGGATYERGVIIVFPGMSLEYQYLLHDLFDEDRVELERVPLVAPNNYYGAIDTLPELTMLPDPILLPVERPIWEPLVSRGLHQYRKSQHLVRHSLHRRGCRHR